uniref:non-specific serine/threonine protein kinase n=1 Tax=Leersia perrieri TaxID=77586 RepID=A0A0D9WF86_9ORYZ
MPPDDESPAVAAAAAGDTFSKVLQGRYELGRVLGRGASSKVYRARDVRDGAHVAVKAIRKPSSPYCCTPEDAVAARRCVEREVAALRRLDGHPHVVRLLDVLATRSTVYLVLELARGGTLLSALDATAGGGRYGEPAARRLFAQLASAVAHAHSRGVFHRDVKPDNLLLDGGELSLKLADFGLSAFAAEEHEHEHDQHQLLAATHCGSPAYVAPESLLKRRPYDAGKADVWSCGVVLFVLAAGYLPFNDGNLMAMYRKICSAKFRFPKWFSPELRSLIGRLLDPEPDTRIKIGDIFDHPWFQQDGKPSFGFIQAACSHPSYDVVKWEAELEQARELNAFDIIGFASGCDLSGLIGALPHRVRFVVPGADVKSTLDRVEKLGREEGLAVMRKEEARYGGVHLEGTSGKFSAYLMVYLLPKEMLMVEAKRASGSEIPKFWQELYHRLLGNCNIITKFTFMQQM